jgi:hypothetical protein
MDEQAKEITISIRIDQDAYDETLEKIAYLKSRIQELIELQAQAGV